MPRIISIMKIAMMDLSSARVDAFVKVAVRGFIMNEKKSINHSFVMVNAECPF
jgi:hypothetical protein